MRTPPKLSTVPRAARPGLEPTANAVDSSTLEGVRRMGMIYSGGEPGQWYRVWVTGKGTGLGNDARFFFGLVRGTPEGAVKEAQKRWPKQVGKMELEEHNPIRLKPVPKSSKSTRVPPKAGGGKYVAKILPSARSAGKAKPLKRR